MAVWLSCSKDLRIIWFSNHLILVEQELPTLPEHLSSPQVFSGVRVTRFLVFMHLKEK
jgi:hypothetical protein